MINVKRNFNTIASSMVTKTSKSSIRFIKQHEKWFRRLKGLPNLKVYEGDFEVFKLFVSNLDTPLLNTFWFDFKSKKQKWKSGKKYISGNGKMRQTSGSEVYQGLKRLAKKNKMEKKFHNKFTILFGTD